MEASKAPAAQPAWQDRLLAVAGYGCLALVELCVAAMSWTGLSGFAHDSLHLDGVQQLMVPVALDGVAASSAFLALRRTLRGKSGAGARLMVFGATGASAYLNWHHARAVYADVAAAQFFAGMSLTVLVLFELVLRELRAGALEDIGVMEDPTARYRLLRWVRFPGETWAAWSTSLRYGITRPNDALRIVWQPDDTTRVEVARVESLDSLDGRSKAELARMALTATDGDVTAALEWLRERGKSVDRSYAYEIKKRQPTSATARIGAGD